MNKENFKQFVGKNIEVNGLTWNDFNRTFSGKVDGHMVVLKIVGWKTYTQAILGLISVDYRDVNESVMGFIDYDVVNGTSKFFQD